MMKPIGHRSRLAPVLGLSTCRLSFDLLFQFIVCFSILRCNRSMDHGLLPNQGSFIYPLFSIFHE